MAASALQRTPLAGLEASAPAQARARAAALRAQAEIIRKRIDEAPSFSAPSEALAKALSALPAPPPQLPIPPPLPSAPTRVRYLHLCATLAQAASVVDDAASFAALVRACEAMPELTLRERLFSVLQTRRPALISRSLDALQASLTSLQWPHLPLSRSLFPGSSPDPALFLASVAQHLSSLSDLAGHTAAAGALSSLLTPRLLYLTASLGPASALPPLLDAIQILLKLLPNSALSSALWPHAIATMLSQLSQRYGVRLTDGTANGSEEEDDEEMASEVDALAQQLLDRYSYPPSSGAFPSTLSLLSRRSSLQQAWAAQVERTSETRLMEALEGSDAWLPMPVTEADFPALPSAAQALPVVLVPLFRRAPAASPSQRFLLQAIASRLVRRFIAELRAAALRVSSAASSASTMPFLSAPAARCAPLNAAVYIQQMLRSWPLRAELPEGCNATDSETEDNVKATMKECVAQIAAQMCRVLDVPSASGAWWQDEKRALDLAAEEACALFAMHVSIVLPAVPPVVRPRFLKHCAGQLQALLLDRVSQLLERAPKEDMAARLRSLHTLASRLLSAHTKPGPLLRTLSALTRIAEGEAVSEEMADRLPAPLVAALLAWRDALHST